MARKATTTAAGGGVRRRAAARGTGRRAAARPAARRTAEAEGAPLVRAWMDDPGSGLGLMECRAPDLLAAPLAFRIKGTAFPAKRYAPATRGFRYWSAATALRRVADLWAPHLARHRVTRWQMGSTLPVSLDAGSGLDAWYDREELAFKRSGSGTAAVHAGESPDILCHEAGHACLDALRPDLWDAPFIEAAAFHESFADMSAVLAALALPEVRTQVVAQVAAGESSPLSRIAEQLGAALRRIAPQVAERLCLRDAVNHWTYVAPESLPEGSLADTLTAEPHSFSRVFTGAFHDLLSALLRARSARPSADDLAQVADDAARLLVDATTIAPLNPDFFARVGASMVDVDARVFAGRHAKVLTAVLRDRRILPATARAAGRRPAVRPETVPARRGIAPPRTASRTVAIDAARFGLETGGILVRVPATATGAGPAARRAAADDNATAKRAAEQFVAGLFENQRITLPARTTAKRIAAGTQHAAGRATHALTRTDGHLRLRRLRFECFG